MPFAEEFKIVGAGALRCPPDAGLLRQRSANPPEWSVCRLVKRMLGMSVRIPEHCRRTGFEVHIENPLEAERNYTFHFCTPRSGREELADFRAAARGASRYPRSKACREIDRRQCGRSLRRQLCDTLEAKLGRG